MPKDEFKPTHQMRYHCEQPECSNKDEFELIELQDITAIKGEVFLTYASPLSHKITIHLAGPMECLIAASLTLQH